MDTHSTLQNHAGKLLRFTNRPTGDRQHLSVEAAIYRLIELTLVANIRGNDTTFTEMFGIADHASTVHSNCLLRMHSGALLGCSIVLTSLIREALEARRVLTLLDDDLHLSTPLERAVQQVVRKHCGDQRMWRIGLGKLGWQTERLPAQHLARVCRKTPFLAMADDGCQQIRVPWGGDFPAPGCPRASDGGFPAFGAMILRPPPETAYRKPFPLRAGDE